MCNGYIVTKLVASAVQWIEEFADYPVVSLTCIIVVTSSY